jgi:hypothetical protein
MANPCKITYTPKGGNPREYDYAEFMTALKDGLFAELTRSGAINPNAMKGENPFVATKQKPSPKQTAQDRAVQSMHEFMKDGISAAYGDVKGGAYASRAREQRGMKDKDYVSYNQDSLNLLGQQKFQELLDRYNSGEKDVFDTVLEAMDNMTDRERKNSPVLSPLYSVVLTKAAHHFFMTGNMAAANKIYSELSASLSAKGQDISTASALSAPEQLANRLMFEDTGRQSFLNRVISGEMTIGEAISEIIAIARLDRDQVTSIVARVVPKVGKKIVVPTKSKQSDKRRAEVQAIKDILDKMKSGQPSAMRRGGQPSPSRQNRIPAEIIPHIEELARSYAEDGAVSVNQIKSRVWANLKGLIPGYKTDVDELIDQAAQSLESTIKSNKKASSEARLISALEGVIDDMDASRKKAVKILSDMILENDPGYVAARSRGEKVKARERLQKILANKTEAVGILSSARAIAEAQIMGNENIDPATKQAIINGIDDMVSDILDMPVGKSELRAASSALSDESIKDAIIDIAIKHYGDPQPGIENLAAQLVSDLGVDPAYANELQQLLQSEIADAVSKKMDKEAARIDRIVGNVLAGKEVRKAVVNAITKGELTDTMLGDALMNALDYRGFSAKDIETLRNYFTRLQQLTPGEELYQQINRYINDVLSDYDETTAAMIGRWLTEQMYISALSSVMNTAVMASGVGAVVSTIQHGIFTAIMNPSRMARALKHARSMRKAKATMGWETVAAKWSKPESQFGETTLLERPEEKSHGAVVRVTQKTFAQIFEDIAKAKGNRKGYFIAQAVLKAINHSVTMSGARKRKWMPSFSQISMTMMSAQDILMGGFLQDMYSYIEADRYVHNLNRLSGVPMKKGTEAWSQYKKAKLDEILSAGSGAIEKMQLEVEEEAMDLIRKGEELPKGWRRRRLRDKIHKAMPAEVVNEMAHQAKKALLLQKPETSLGAWIFDGVSRAQGIKDSDNAGRVFGKTILNMTLGFMRLNIITAEYAWKSVPVIPAAAKIAKGTNIRYVDGKQTEVPMTTEDKVNVILKNAAATMVWAGLMASMFDYDEEEEKIVLDPDSPIKFYGSAEDSKQRAEIEAEGGKENSINVFGVNIPLLTLGFAIGSVGKVLGEVSNDIRFSKDGSSELTFDKMLALVVGQMTGSEMSAPKRALDKVYRGYGEPKAGEALEILMLDGIETALSPSQIEQIKNDYEAWKGYQKEKRSGVVDNIVEDIYFLDAFMDTKGGKMYDHFGQPVYVTPKTDIVTFLMPEKVWKDGTSHVENSPYYNLTEQKWFPKNYSSWNAKAWNEVRIFGKTYEVPIEDEFKQSIGLVIDKETSAVIDSHLDVIKGLNTDDRKVEMLKDYRQRAVDTVRSEFERLTAREISKSVSPGMPEDQIRVAVGNAREKVILEMRTKYKIDQ